MEKYFLKLLLLVLIVAGSNKQSYASHMVGGDLTYSCTSTAGVYHVTLTFYRDCQGIPVCNGTCSSTSCKRSISLIGGEGTCDGVTYGSNISLSFTSVSDVNINPLCPNAKSICDNMGCVTPGTLTPAIEKYIFEGDVNFNSYAIPSTCCKVNIVFQESARNGAINTGAANQNFYITSMVDRCVTPCNNAPVFTNEPRSLICAGENYLFNLGGIDPDGDSLSYSFVQPLVAFNQSVTWTSPYNYDNPFAHLTPDNLPFPYGMRCDSITGDIGFKPVYNLNPGEYFTSIMAVGVTQWRYVNGVATIVGQTRRDIQMSMQACDPNNPPTFLTNPASSADATKPKLDWAVIAGQTLCFDIIAKDTDYKPFNSPPLSDTTYLSWNSALAAKGATFLPKYTLADRNKPAPTGGPREDIYEFCWTPDSAMARTLPYYFTASAKDTKCPKPGTATRAFSIKVFSNPPTLSAGISTSVNTNSCYSWNMSYTSSTSASISTQKWKVSNTSGTFNDSNNMSFSTQSVSNMMLSDTGHFVVKLTLNEGLSNELILFDTIYQQVAAPKVYPALADTLICKASPMLFKATVIKGKTPFQYSWKSTSVLSTADTLLIKPTSITTYTLTVTDASGCKTYDTVVVDTRALPILTRPQAVQVCKSTAISNLSAFTNSPTGGTSVWSYAAASGAVTNGSTPQVRIDSLKNLPSSTTLTSTDNWIKYTYTSPSTSGSCVAVDSAIVRVFSNPIAEAGSAAVLCAADASFELTPHQSSTPSGGVWTGTGVSLSGGKYLFAPAASPATNTLYYTYTHVYNANVSCSNKDSVVFTVNANPIVEAGAPASMCASDATIDLNVRQSSTPVGGVWIGKGVSLSGTTYMFNPSLANPTTNKLYYSYTNAATCSSSDSVIYTVNPNPTTPVVSGADTTTENQATNYSVSNNAGSTYAWFIDNGTINSGQGTNAVSVVFNTIGTNNIKVIETAASTCVSDTGIKTIVVDQVTGIDEQTTFDQFSLYPNPTTGLVTIELKTAEKHLSLEVVDVLGKVVKTAQYSPSIADFTTTLDLGQLKPGLYFITIKGGNKTAQSKITLK